LAKKSSQVTTSYYNVSCRYPYETFMGTYNA